MRFKQRIMRFVVLAILLSATLVSCRPECECLPPPETDTTPPTAELQISYYVDGNSESKTVSAQDPPVTIYADEDHDVVVRYFGRDGEGMKSLQPLVTVYRRIGALQEVEEWNVVATTTSCPTPLVVERWTTFERNKGERTIVTSLMATNWIGLTTSTPSITITIEE